MNEWLLILLVTLFFALFAIVVIVVIFGAWLGVRKLTGRLAGLVPGRHPS